MLKMFISPGRYVQGAGAVKELGKHISCLSCKNALLIVDPIGIKAVGEGIYKSLENMDITCHTEEFRRECCQGEIDSIVESAKKYASDIVVAVGGGKTIDIAKAVSYKMETKLAVIPTIAATDAPCSALSVIYTKDGVFESFLVLPKNPDLVLVDTEVIAKAPVRLFVSGMGDALSTWFEADTSFKTCTCGMQQTLSTLAAQSLARTCYETIITNGYEAKLAVERGVVTEAVERVTEANTLLSGLGFESGGLAAAHSFQDGVTVLEETHKYFHGEKVSFGVIFQLVLENRSEKEINEVLDFCLKVGLPVSLEDIGVVDIDKPRLWKVAVATVGPEETIHSEPFEVTPEKAFAALLVADALGKEAKNKFNKLKKIC